VSFRKNGPSTAVSMRHSDIKSVRLFFVEAARHLNFPGGAYVVTAKLPERDGELEYRVRSGDEPHERVVRLLRAAP
jgi:hypothetical protein